MSDFAFLESPLFDSIMEHRSHHEEVLRECLERNLKNSFNSAETALGHLGEMVRTRLDVSEEIKNAKTILSSFLLMIDAYERVAKQQERNDG